MFAFSSVCLLLENHSFAGLMTQQFAIDGAWSSATAQGLHLLLCED
jgi:hypothetical protein